VRRRILVAIVGLTILATIVLSLPLAVLIANRENDDAPRELDRIAQRTAADLPPNFTTHNGPVEIPEVETSIDVGVYNRAGARIAGIGPARADRVTASANIVTVEGSADGQRIVARPIVVRERTVGVIGSRSRRPRRAHGYDEICSSLLRSTSVHCWSPPASDGSSPPVW
jgi:hypothetical protein